MSISGIAGEIGGVNYYNNVNRKTNSQAETFSMENYDKTNVNDENDLANMDYWKFIAEKKKEIYEKLKNNDTKVRYQIGSLSLTEDEWDKMLEKVDDISDKMREAMRAEHKKRFEKQEKADFMEYETENYKFVPEPDIGEGGLRILVDGKSVAVFSMDDLKIRVDEQTGTRVLISEIAGIGGAWYDAIPVNEELEQGLAEAMGIESVPEVVLDGYYIGTHAGTGIQYVMRPGDEGRGGKVLLRNEADAAKYNALAEEYYNRYPNLVTSQEVGRIWASFEIVGMAERTETGFVRIGYDNISYNDNYDYKKNWSVMLTGNTWKLLDEWLKENRRDMKEKQELESWIDVINKIGGTYKTLV